MPREIWPYILVTVGGALGALTRFVIVQSVNTTAAGDWRFPLGTFLVNIGGSFVLGIVGTILAERIGTTDHALSYAVAIGFLGSLTTFSTFAFEKHRLVESGEWYVAAGYLGITVAVGLLAVRAGVLLARQFLG